MKKTIHRSSKTGKLVTEEFAEEHPATTETEKVEVKESVREPIGMLSANFGQEDLNKMVDKINEIIVVVNNVV